MNLTPDILEGFASGYLSPLYDDPQPTPDFHRKCWELYCQDITFASVAAPRGHAKSTALTHAFGIAVVVFRITDYVLVVSATEDLAIAHLEDIAKQLRENEDLRADFGISKLTTDAKTEVVVQFTDGHEAKLIAKGSGQKLRGLKWHGKRPGLILGDDLEEDEQVDSQDRRVKFRRWVNRALIPTLSARGIIRLHGTILHEDSYLARTLRSGSWKHLFYKAHEGFDDFSNILWPELWPERRLREKRQQFIDDNDASGYSQEYLNSPLDSSDAYLLKDWFLGMTDDDQDLAKKVAAAVDFAVSTKDHANRTAIAVGGEDSRNILHALDMNVGKFDSLEIIEAIFEVQEVWNPEMVFVEKGQIWSALEPMFRKEMQERGIWINFVEVASVRDKATRGRTLQKRMRNGGMRWDKDAEWFAACEDEMLRFTGSNESAQDDQFDAWSLLAIGFEKLAPSEEEDFDEPGFNAEDDWYLARQSPAAHSGRNTTTGY